jgi:multidrug efflux pump subunit AcrB
MLEATLTGVTVTQLRDDIYLIDVVVRATDAERLSIDTLRAMPVPLPDGRTVPLAQIAIFADEQEYPLVWRRDRVPTLTVLSDVVPGVLPEAVVARVAPAIAELAETLPPDIRIELGGIAEESATSRGLVLAVVPAMVAVMLTVLMFQLQGFGKLALVVATLPLGIIGVVLALLAFRQPLGFVAILGILALLGMIAKNAVILIVQIEAERGSGRELRDAVVEGLPRASGR